MYIGTDERLSYIGFGEQHALLLPALGALELRTGFAHLNKRGFVHAGYTNEQRWVLTVVQIVI